MKPTAINAKVIENNLSNPSNSTNPYAPKIENDKPVRDVNKNPYAPVK